MKGLLLTELMEWIEREHGLAMVDQAILNCHPPTDGAFTVHIPFDHRILFGLLTALADGTGRPARAVQREFGRYLVNRIVSRDATPIRGYKTTLEALASAQDVLAATQLFDRDFEESDLKLNSCGQGNWVFTIQAGEAAIGLVWGALESFIAQFEEPLTVEFLEVCGSGNELVFDIRISDSALSCLTTHK